ncbi:MAG: UDP-N-acetylmuramate--L-alanine ligase, partial [Hyphomicrobiaceae bacterium]|nr:UDP-N-acetylmuramate--L-alanine ligase [Hyphomicrobiaceae bacterium]
NAYGTNARLGGSEWMVVEADESDGTFVKLPADIAIVTNIDPEHLDHYGTFDGLRAAFCQFVENLPFYGFAAMCLDHPEVQALVGRIEDRRILTYGENPQADVRVVDIEPKGRRTRFSILLRDRRQGTERRIEALELPMAGLHNVLNATAAIAVAIGVGIGDEAIRKGLSGFEGVKRRFTPMGGYNGIEVFDDYAHHPVEIAAALKAARSAGSGKIIAVVQPHRYSRLKNLFDGFCSCFNDADIVIVAPVYEAGESPIEGASRDDLVAGLRARGHRQVIALDGPDDLARLIADKAAPGDMVVCLGAGSVTNWAAALPGQLDALGEGTGA